MVCACLFEVFLSADSSVVLFALATLAVVIFIGRFLLDLAWRFVIGMIVVIIAFYTVTVSLPSLFILI